MGKQIDFQLLICPNCRATLAPGPESLRCVKCEAQYRRKQGAVFFQDADLDDALDPLARLKGCLKRFNKFYRFLDCLLSPVYYDRHLMRFLKKHVDGKPIVGVNLGSGNNDISANLTNVDIFSFPNVNIVGDISNLPFRDSSIDVVINYQVLEHTPNPEKIVSEILRVLKPGGWVYTVFPFMQGFHASPYDYSRRTFEGIQVLHKGFEMKETRCVGGPTSGLLWVLQDYVAIILSLGSERVYSIVYVVMMLVTFPVKFLDVILVHHPLARKISSSFVYVGVKPGGNW